MKTNDIVIRPIITEESMKYVPAGKYTFVVARQADKGAIRKAINQMFGVTVISIATSVVKGKTQRVGKRRAEVTKSVWKKAIVTVKKGEKIGLFEPGGEDAHKGHMHK
jgi:large subunit ribosomal protein L23